MSLSLDKYIAPLEVSRIKASKLSVQLQVKAAAEIAAVLKRTLIMPKMYCGLENLWQPHKGRYWDGVQNYTLPMQCSMTQLFDVLR